MANVALDPGRTVDPLPDVSVYRDNPSMPEDHDEQLIGDPRVIVEVPSASTSSLDQTVKREEYLTLPGVTDIVSSTPRGNASGMSIEKATNGWRRAAIWFHARST